MFVIAKHQRLLERLGLTTLAGVEDFKGDLIKNHRGRRDILKITCADERGTLRELFLKRNLNPYRKDGIASLLRHGKVISQSRREWENLLKLQNAGLQTCGLVAYGHECTALREKFSFLITEAAPGQRLDQFLEQCRDTKTRRLVLRGLAGEIRRMHDAGFATPDLFTKHIFVETASGGPRFSFIDMARLDERRKTSDSLRARDLAALNLTARLKDVSPKERLWFLKSYAGQVNRNLVRQIASRVKHLLKRRKFNRIYGFETGGGSLP